ncbi:MAG: type IVB secretion system protein IcmV [Gammaproteobacteria bacterium]|nr:type IVB secretion system protein IcmV [Gammaproteobacteria bacterium]
MSVKPGARIGARLSRVFRFKLWLDVDRIKGFTLYITGMFKKFFVPQPQKPKESFDLAKERLDLDDELLLKRQRALLRVSILMLFFAVLLVGYGIYQVFYGAVLGVLLSVVVTFIALTLAFRYHFWYFQIREKKLGCSFKQWLHEGLLGGKKS